MKGLGLILLAIHSFPSHKGLLPVDSGSPSTCQLSSTLLRRKGHPGSAILAAGEAGRGSVSLCLCLFRGESGLSVIFHRTHYINCESRVKRNFKIKSETTGYVQEGEDYAGVFISRSCSIMSV